MRIKYLLVIAFLHVAGLFAVHTAVAQQPGPFSVHEGLQITRAYTSDYGPDAEEYNKITSATDTGILIDYSDTRGINAKRSVRAIDRQSAQIYILGYAEGLPVDMPGATSLGISTRTLEELRRHGEAAVAIIYDTSLKPMNGVLTLERRNFTTTILVEDQTAEIPIMQVTGVFRRNKRSAKGEFLILDDADHPVMINYTIKFDYESQPRTVRTVRVTGGLSQRAAMEHTLKTLNRLDVYGIHFDFDKATIRREAWPLIADIGQMLQDNPGWTLSIEGHTDSIGNDGYNLSLSEQRAAAVVNALVTRHGVDPARLRSIGRGETNPKADNRTLQGRAINRRVELVRTDR